MSDNPGFIHLHVHSQFSLLSSVCKISDLVDRAARCGMNALALTDMGNLFGAIEFYQACHRKGIKPILGCDIFVAPESRLERSTHGLPHASYPLVLLCENAAGYGNLIKLVSKGYLEGFYYRPRVDKELLAEHHEGLIALSGSISSEIPHLINIGQQKRAKEAAQRYKEIFGAGNYFLEIQDSKLRDQEKVNGAIMRLSKELDIPLAATSNVLFMDRKDSEALEVMYCIQNQNTLLDEGRQRVHTSEYCFKTVEEMRESFARLPEALENTVRIAGRCNVEIDFKTVHLPYFETPEGMTPADYLRNLTIEGARRRYPEWTFEVQERIDHELGVIHKLGYNSYFLIVWDFVRFAKEKGIPVGPGRGSAAGSVVSYSLGITNLDPLKYGLLFERFLNPDRVSLPDIDIDFCYERRDEVIQYVTEKYSKDNVAQIITFGTMMAKGVLRDVGRVLAMPYADVDKIAKLVPNELNITLEEALAQEPQLKEMVAKDPQIRRLFEFAKALEGMPRHASTHAAGVVISEKPLTENVPLFKTPDGQVSTMFPMTSLEKINILKMDFLGLRTLSVVDDTVKIIKRTKKQDVNIDAVSLTDEKTFDLLSRAQSGGVFQLESSGMRDILRKLKPDVFEDLIAVLALFRPGPIGSGMVDDFIRRKNGTVRFQYDHPLLEPILKDTYGIMVYQEQIMKIANSLSGFSLAEADSLRRAISKKKPEVIELQKKQFVQGCVKQKISERLADKVFELIMHFAGYGFNKSHSAAYAMISYQTAYLKAHFPVEFMTALLSSEKDNSDKVAQYIDEAKRMGLKVLPPDANESFPRFTVVGTDAIRFGLAAVKNVGQAAIDSVIQSRIKGGNFRSLYDFCERVDSRAVNRKTIESLIKCGAFDSLGCRRSQLMATLDASVAYAAQIQRDRQSGQFSLFDRGSKDGGFRESSPALPDIAEWPEHEKLAFEKQLLGFYVTGHPLERYSEQFEKYSGVTSANIGKEADGSEVLIGSLVAKLKFTVTKKNQERMAILGLEDLEGTVEALVFPRVFAEYGHLLVPDAILFFKGRVDKKEENPKLIVQEIYSVSSLQNRMTRSVMIELKSASADEKMLHKLQDVLSKSPGQTPVYLSFLDEAGGRSEVIIDRSLFVSPNPDFVHNVEGILGRGSVRLHV